MNSVARSTDSRHSAISDLLDRFDSFYQPSTPCFPDSPEWNQYLYDRARYVADLESASLSYDETDGPGYEDEAPILDDYDAIQMTGLTLDELRLSHFFKDAPELFMSEVFSQS